MRNMTLHRYLNTEIATDEPALNLIFAQRHIVEQFRKNEVIYKRGVIPKYLCYIQQGNAIAITRTSPQRSVFRFWVPGQFICPVGLFNNEAITHSVISLDNCLIYKIDYLKLFAFLREFPMGYKILNSIIQKEIQLMEVNIKSLDQNKRIQNHESFLQALSITFSD